MLRLKDCDSRQPRWVQGHPHSDAQITLIHRQSPAWFDGSPILRVAQSKTDKSNFSSWWTFSANNLRTCLRNTSVSSMATGIERPCVCVSKPVYRILTSARRPAIPQFELFPTQTASIVQEDRAHAHDHFDRWKMFAPYQSSDET